MRVGRVRATQHDFRACDQRRQRRAQLVSHVGVEALQLVVGSLKSVQETVEAMDEWLKLARLLASIQALAHGACAKQFSLAHQATHR